MSLLGGVTEDVIQILMTGLGGVIMSLGGFEAPTPVSTGTSSRVGCNGTFRGTGEGEGGWYLVAWSGCWGWIVGSCDGFELLAIFSVALWYPLFINIK